MAMEVGYKITLTSESDQKPGLEPGNVISVIDEKKRDFYFKIKPIKLFCQVSCNKVPKIKDISKHMKKMVKVMKDLEVLNVKLIRTTYNQ
ncbi:hypothetical protein CDAR_402341 [Caerostris darwini]|uniref:Uncharacterized protein n=1 Tax=Caerostris darwini TaxID=1538125 RepID=A0AAV4R5E1_9ARAC|nr:hypothetical protein CDAR_402341 [Caerostris darwini]